MKDIKIKFDVTITIDEGYVELEYQEPISTGKPPTIQEIIHDALEDLWTTHRFGTSMTAKNVVIEMPSYDSEEGVLQVRKIEIE